MIDVIFKNKKADFDKLRAYGFVPKYDNLIYSTPMMNNQFMLHIQISAAGSVSAKLIDQDFNDEYRLHLMTDAVGKYVGQVRSEYQSILQQIADKCFETNIFKSDTAQAVIDYIKQKYQDELEFLWPKFSHNAAVRRQDNRKWYAVFLDISADKIGLLSQEPITILCVRNQPEKILQMIDHQKYFPGYHMNKKHWLTVCLNGTVHPKEIQKRLDESYALAQK